MCVCVCVFGVLRYKRAVVSAVGQRKNQRGDSLITADGAERRVGSAPDGTFESILT